MDNKRDQTMSIMKRNWHKTSILMNTVTMNGEEDEERTQEEVNL
jgi:hypothetical protein